MKLHITLKYKSNVHLKMARDLEKEIDECQQRLG